MHIVKFFRFDHNHQSFPTSLTKWNISASLRFHVRERPEKFLFSALRRKFYGRGFRDLDFSLFDKHEFAHGIFCSVLLFPVCIAGHHIYVTDLCNFFFIPQDLTDRINFYFQRITFQRNLLLIDF